MALTFPAPVSYIADILRVPSRVFSIEPQQEYSALGSGEILAADLAPQRWIADIRTKPLNRAAARVLQTRLEALDGSINAFYLYDPWKCVPAADPNGTLLGASSVTINSLPANNKSMSLIGLPAGYVLSEGDLLAFDYGTNPVRRALHRVCETVTAGGGGNSGVFEVRPHIRPGSTTGIAVTLIKPAAKMVLVPSSLSIAGNGGFSVVSFRAMQTFR